MSIGEVIAIVFALGGALMPLFALPIFIIVLSLKPNKLTDLRYKKKENAAIYSDLLQNEKWKCFREKIKSRDNFQCKWCGAQKNLAVHHKYYLKLPNNDFVQPWEYPDDALITLCKKCHEKAHKKYNNKVYYITKEKYNQLKPNHNDSKRT